GRIDVWVNNAGVTNFSLLEEGPFDKHRRVIETNLFGAMYAARAVVPIFREQKRGVMVNVASVLGRVGHPFVPSYVISKFALRGLSEALRAELAELPDVHVCTIYPYAVDTPHFQSASSEIGAPAVSMPPMQSPEKVARAIVELIERPRRQRHVPRIAALGVALHALAPRTVEELLTSALRRWHFAPRQQLPTAGNLYEPTAEQAAIHGDRPPRIGTVRFALWSLGELARIEARRARRRLRRWAARPA
ncbi:MAG TPA: SDR family NAD(P)-dependent oxidoreductase, partial [Sandaracinaceae bacterium]